MTHVIYDEFAVTLGKQPACYGEVRYTVRVIPGRQAVTWANAPEGSAPAEAASVNILDVSVRFHTCLPWMKADAAAWEMLTSNVSDAWFLSRIAEAAE